MSGETNTVHLAGVALLCSCHACAFFHSRDDEYRALLHFLKEGMEAGDKSFHVVDGKQRAERLERFEAAGIDVAGAERCGQLEMHAWENAYLRGGRFEQDVLLATHYYVEPGEFLRELQTRKPRHRP